MFSVAAYCSLQDSMPGTEDRVASTLSIFEQGPNNSVFLSIPPTHKLHTAPTPLCLQPPLSVFLAVVQQLRRCSESDRLVQFIHWVSDVSSSVSIMMDRFHPRTWLVQVPSKNMAGSVRRRKLTSSSTDYFDQGSWEDSVFRAAGTELNSWIDEKSCKSY